MEGPIGYEILAMRKACETQPYQRQDCPICGHPLELTIDGILHDRFCGWTDQSPAIRNTPKP
jgi:hypothetical protein